MNDLLKMAEIRTDRLVITALLLISMMVGCAQDKSWADQHQIIDALEKHGYTDIKKVNRTGPGASDPWAAICNKEEKEWLVIIQPDWKLSTTEMGIDGRLTLEQLRRKLAADGSNYLEQSLVIVKDTVHSTFEYPVFCWIYQDSQRGLIKNMDLYGNQFDDK